MAWSLRKYSLASLLHLLPVEFTFYAAKNIFHIDGLEYINYMYMICVALHGLNWFSKNYGNDIYEILMLFRQNKEKFTALLKCVKTAKPDSATPATVDNPFTNTVDTDIETDVIE